MRQTHPFEILITKIRQDDKANIVLGKTRRIAPVIFSSHSATCCIAAAHPNFQSAWYALE